MCNLYRMTSTVAEIAKTFGSFDGDRSNLPSFDAIYPNREAPILRQQDGKLTLETILWGVPPPAKGSRLVTNVRNLASPFWRSMLNSPEQRCLVPVTSFCEWEGEAGSKRKVWFGRTDTPLFAFAGLWRQTKDGPRMAFLTTEANEIVGAVHPKAMPVLLDAEDHDVWLTGDYEAATGLARPFDDSRMEIVEREG
jgi:putative SOS response-associated peptidase YedK